MRRTATLGCCCALLAAVASGLCSCANTTDVNQSAVAQPPDADGLDAIFQSDIWGWGPVVDGLQCRISDARCQLVPPDPGQTDSVRLDVIVELRNVSEERIRVPFDQWWPLPPLISADATAIQGLVYEAGGRWTALGHTWTLQLPPGDVGEVPDDFVELDPNESAKLDVSEYIYYDSWPGGKIVLRFYILSRHPSPSWQGEVSTGKYLLSSKIPVLVGPVHAGDFKIAVSRASIGKALLRHKDDEEDLTESKENYLIIGVRISNISEREKTDFQTWGALPPRASRSPASLTDELGNEYKPIHFGPSRKPALRKDSAVIYPRNSLVDVLIFSLPPKKIRVLKLSLPLGNVGGKDQITLKIPTALVTGILGLRGDRPAVEE